MGLFHICCTWVAWVSFCSVPYLRSENNLRRFDFLRHRRFNWCKKLQVLSVSLTDSFRSSYCWQLFSIPCFFFASAIGLSEKNFHQHELVSIENFSSWRIKAWSCQWVVNQHWRVCEPKVKKFRKVKVLVRVHFQRKWRVEQKQKVQERKELWQLQVSNIEKRQVTSLKRSIEKWEFENFLENAFGK